MKTWDDAEAMALHGKPGDHYIMESKDIKEYQTILDIEGEGETRIVKLLLTSVTKEIPNILKTRSVQLTYDLLVRDGFLENDDDRIVICSRNLIFRDGLEFDQAKDEHQAFMTRHNWPHTI